MSREVALACMFAAVVIVSSTWSGFSFGETPTEPSETAAVSDLASWPGLSMPKFEIADGPFAPNWDSLRKYYSCPEWFRDAKFGIWAHWGPQSEAEAGDWYTRNMYIEGHRQYKHHLENYGNMLLNVAPKGDGTIDAEQRRIVEDIGAWLRVNGEAIYGARPWLVAREGNIRFTRNKANTTLYATLLGWPGEKAAIKTVASADLSGVKSVQLLGVDTELKWHQDDEGMVVVMPERPELGMAYTLRFEFASSIPSPRH